MKKLTIITLLILPLFLSSCITRAVIKDRKSYKETFYSYYVSQYGGDVIFIGKKYHYVFKDKNNQISEFTKVAWKDKLQMSGIQLFVNSDNEVNGSVYLESYIKTKNLQEEMVQIFKKYGFEEGEKGFFSKSIALDGIRYRPIANSNQPYKGFFGTEYHTKIKYNLNSKEELRKALITPIAVTADGILIVGGGTIIPLLIIAITADK